ncbi:MAG: GTPase Era [Oscillospiraceae bacterium]|nr:GTPase Era [Oscillospiraceae bacterium]
MTTSAFIVLVGEPNVGKSTLLNALVGAKVAIVSDKPQTTRSRVMGVRTDGDEQLVFVDTPGQHTPRTRLGDYMVKTIAEAMSGVDAAVLVTEPRECREDELSLLRRLWGAKIPVVLAINKTDTLRDKGALLPIIADWAELGTFAAITPASALTGDGLPDLLAELRKFTFESPHFFPGGALTDQPDRILAAELLREQLLRFMQQEIPHGVAVVVERMEEQKSQESPKESGHQTSVQGDSKKFGPTGPNFLTGHSRIPEEGGQRTILYIDATIYCERESHKGMIIGKGGAMLKAVATAAREQMEAVFGEKVHLQAWVKVKEDWRNRQNLLSGFGYS